MTNVTELNPRKAVVLKHSEIRNPAFSSELHALGELSLPVKTSWNIGRIIKQVMKANKDAQPEFQKIIDKHFKKDDKGNLVPAKNDEGKPIPGAFEFNEATTEAKAAYEKDFADFMDIEVELKSHKLRLEDMVDKAGQPIELKPNTLQVLDELFEVG